MAPKMAIGSPGSFARRVRVPLSFIRVYRIVNPRISDPRALEY